jgi:hypothetical protein
MPTPLDNTPRSPKRATISPRVGQSQSGREAGGGAGGRVEADVLPPLDVAGRVLVLAALVAPERLPPGARRTSRWPTLIWFGFRRLFHWASWRWSSP